MPTRVGFLFFFHSYHAYHSGPTAFELSRLDPELEVHLFTSSDGSYDLLTKLATRYPGHRCVIHRLSAPWLFRVTGLSRTKGSWFPKPQEFPGYQGIIALHADKLAKMDAVVGTTFAALRLKSKLGIKTQKYIKHFHGTQARAYAFQDGLRDFDLLLLSGPQIRERLDELGILRDVPSEIVGYPKFDVTSHNSGWADTRFAQKRPVVLYNPHFERGLSSWFEWGRQVLEFFSRRSDYNLIFAPHVELKRRSDRGLSLAQYDGHPHIHVDLGSERSADMTYSLSADIYLGDVSSQIFEFVYRPRPCIFFNSHRVAWEGDPSYGHWTLGRVIDDVSALEDALANADAAQQRYEQTQRDYFAAAIELNDTPSAQRAAEAIRSFLRGTQR